MMSRILHATLLAGALCALATLLASPLAAQERLLVPFTGEFVDAESRPVSGVFDVTLRLVDDASGRPVWSEERWVSAVDGAYRVMLGEMNAIPAELAGRTMTLSVEVAGAGEVSRAPITVRPVEPTPSRAEVLAGLEITWADLAERAVLAHDARTADDCSTLEGRSLAQIDRYDELLAEIVRVREQVAQARGTRLGNQSVTLERIGGAGGSPFARTCPPGHVVVGIRGAAGALIDSLELVCAPLQ